MVSFMNGELTLVLKWNIKFCDEGAKILLNSHFSIFKGLLGDCGTFVYLSDTSLMSVEVLAFEQGNETCVTGYCKELNVPNHF